MTSQITLQLFYKAEHRIVTKEHTDTSHLYLLSFSWFDFHFQRDGNWKQSLNTWIWPRAARLLQIHHSYLGGFRVVRVWLTYLHKELALYGGRLHIHLLLPALFLS